jgi:hypothetical protein
MDIQAKKQEIIRMIQETDDPDLIETVMFVLTEGVEKGLTAAMLESEMDNIIESRNEMNDGDYIDNEHIHKRR